MIVIPYSYKGGLKSSTPVYVDTTSKGTKFKANSTKSSDKLIPPLNTNITFSSAPKLAMSAAKLRALPPVPETWDWRYSYPSDTPEIANRKNLLSKSGNQYKCGSCWAISTAGIVSDLFALGGIVQQNPELSTTYSLACYPQAQCMGGDPSALFQDISQNGITDDTCVDYSWCVSNDSCNGSALKHFDESGINSLVPSCGCYYDTPKYIYKIKNITRIGMSTNDLSEQETVKLQAQNHIYNIGPVLGGFLVFDNFMSGKFTQINNGVYLENVDYNSNPGEMTFGYKPNYKGSHAVAIIGWGVAKDTRTSEKTVEDVPYWYCRNSWTEDWGDGGFFKIAMYPYNKLAQFDKIVVISASDGDHQAGGMLLCEPAGPPEVGTLKKTNYEGDKLRSDSFYIKLPDVFSQSISIIPAIGMSKYYILAVLILGVIGVAVYFIVKKYRKK